MDRLEYIMWRDTIRYKYQLDKSLQLSEQEIEEKIDELERTMSESMPYFFEGKEQNRHNNSVDNDKSYYCFSVYVATKEDYEKWMNDDTYLFCGALKKELGSPFSFVYPRGRVQMENFKKVFAEKLANNYPIKNYYEVISIIRNLNNDNLDLTNWNVVKKIFKEYDILTYNEFINQDRYVFHSQEVVLPDGQAMVLFTLEWKGYNECGGDTNALEKDNDEESFDE